MEHIIKINASKMYYMVLNTAVYMYDYVLYMDKLYVSCHAPIMDNSENNQLRFYRVYNILLTNF